jgi:hypothetical protein
MMAGRFFFDGLDLRRNYLVTIRSGHGDVELTRAGRGICSVADHAFFLAFLCEAVQGTN